MKIAMLNGSRFRNRNIDVIYRLSKAKGRPRLWALFCPEKGQEKGKERRRESEIIYDVIVGWSFFLGFTSFISFDETCLPHSASPILHVNTH